MDTSPAALPAPLPHIIEILEPDEDDCAETAALPEGNVKLRNYRLLSENLRAYTPTGDIHTSPTKQKLVSRFDVCATISPPRARILELLRPEDPGREALEAIVRPAPRRGLARPLDEDTRRFLQRALLSPSPQELSAAATPEPHYDRSPDDTPEPERQERQRSHDPPQNHHHGNRGCLKRERSLAEELREAEEEERSGVRRDPFRELRVGGAREAWERDRLGRMALAVEEDEGETGALSAAARRLDELLAESRELHAELAGIHQDFQLQCARAWRCAAAARALQAESVSLRFLDDVVSLLRGDVRRARRAYAWPFALGNRRAERNYVI